MYLCFIDESNTPPRAFKKGTARYFVIAGLIVHEAQWHGLRDDVQKLRNRLRYQVRGEIKWRYFGPDNDDPENSLAHLAPEVRYEFRRELYDIILRRKSIKIVACVASVETAYSTSYVKNAEALYRFTYKAVSERFQYFLQDTTYGHGEQQLGIIVADQRGRSQDELLRKEHHGLVDQERIFTSKYKNYVETIFLTPSHLSVGIQLADMVAGAIGRAFNSNDPTCFEHIKPAFRAAPDGTIDGYGLAKFPKKGWK